MTTLTKEQADRMRLLVVDLRANGHLQGKNALRTADNTFCCLGRACELSGLGVWDEIYNTSSVIAYIVPDERQYWGVMPNAVRDWYGFECSGGFYDAEDHALDALNDAGVSFASIADRIEQRYHLTD
jgi:hypothetical protein